MDAQIRKHTRKATRHLNRKGISAPRIGVALGVMQFAVLLALFCNTYLVRAPESTASQLFMLTLLIGSYIFLTLFQVRQQIAAAAGTSAAGRDYVALTRKYRHHHAGARLIALGLAVGAVSAIPDILALEKPDVLNGSVMLSVMIIDAARQYLTC